MSAYRGRHAELYDLFYADKPYGDEASFVHRCIQELSPLHVSRLLELACGTGQHSFAFEKLGYQVVATDYSNDMLEQAKRKAAVLASGVDFRFSDMRDLRLAGEEFDCAVCLFDSIGYVETNEALINVLNGVYRHLRPGGLFIFEFWHAAAMLVHFEPVRVRRWEFEGSKILRISETTLNIERQLARVNYSIYEFRPDGPYVFLQEVQKNRYFLIQEVAFMLESANFKPIRWFSGFCWDAPICEDSWHILAVAQKVSCKSRQTKQS